MSGSRCSSVLFRFPPWPRVMFIYFRAASDSAPKKSMRLCSSGAVHTTGTVLVWLSRIPPSEIHEWKTVDTSGKSVTWNDGRQCNPYVAKRSFFRGSVTMSRFLVRPACSAARRGSCSTSRGPKSDADVPLHAAVHDRHSARAGFAPAQLLSIDAHYGGVDEQSAYRRSPS